MLPRSVFYCCEEMSLPGNSFFFKNFLWILDGFHIRHPRPTHPLLPPSALATSPSKTKFKGGNTHTKQIKIKSRHGSCTVTQ